LLLRWTGAHAAKSSTFGPQQRQARKLRVARLALLWQVRVTGLGEELLTP